MSTSGTYDVAEFSARAEEAPDRKPFLVTDRRSVSYGELHERMAKLERLYREKGLERGARVLLGVRDDVETSILFLSLQRSGITCALLDPESSARELETAVETARPDAIFADEANYRSWGLADLEDRLFVMKVASEQAKKKSLAGRLLRKKKAAEPAADAGSYPGLLAELDESSLPTDLDPESTAWVIFTSGTTSKPKGVEMSHRGQMAHLRTLTKLFGYDADSQLLNVLPLHHVDGGIQGPILTYYNGATLHRPCAFNAANIPLLLDTVYAQRITHFIAVPTILSLIYRLGGGMEDAFDTEDFQLIVSAAARLEEPLWRNFEERFSTTLCNLYGLTETVTGSIFSGPGPPTRCVGSIGKPVDCEVEILGEDGKPVPPGEQGEIVISGDHLMTGYFGNPEATAEVLKDGRFHTGDLGRVDEDGFYHVVGRAKNIIICGGENIAPDEVTTVLEAHPQIVEATTIGMPDPDWGEKVVSCVAVEPGSGLDVARIIDHCREKLSAYKVPRRVVLVESLPRGPSGKVVQSEVKKLIENASRLSGEVDESDLAPAVIQIAADCFQTTADRLTVASGPHNTDGWDSLAHMELVAGLEEAFGIQLGNRDIMAIENIDAAVNIVKEHLASK